MLVGSKAQEERDGGRLSAGRELPVIADGDGEQEKRSMGTPCWKESAVSLLRKMRKRRSTLS